MSRMHVVLSCIVLCNLRVCTVVFEPAASLLESTPKCAANVHIADHKPYQKGCERQTEKDFYCPYGVEINEHRNSNEETIT